MKPYVNKINRGRRLKFGKEMFEKPVDFLEECCLVRRVKIRSCRLGWKVMVWRTAGEEFDLKCTIPMVKHGDGSIIVWGVCELENCVCHGQILLSRYFGTKSTTINQ